MHVIVPTLNAARDWDRFAAALLACVPPEQVLVVDSQSTDDTVHLALSAGFKVHSIARKEFNHGSTRMAAAEMVPESEVLVYMTQDAVLAGPKSIFDLVAALEDPSVAAAYGRQLPRPGAGAIESHARYYNYPASPHICSLVSREAIGIKAVFISNSFAAYRRSALMDVGGFPRDVIFGEDTIVAAKLLLAGKRIAYVSDATVYHSHEHTCIQEFKRYFDIGVLHHREKGLLSQFGAVHGEGKKFVISELRYLVDTSPMSIPFALMRTGVKFLGHRMGMLEPYIPRSIKGRLSAAGRSRRLVPS